MLPPDPTHFTLASRSLKLDSAADISPHLLHISPPNPATHPTTLSLQGNTLGLPACQHLASILQPAHHPQLETANLADIFTGRLLAEIPPSLSALLTALLHLPKLHTLDLSDNAFGLNTVDPLVAFLSRHVPLRHLILQNNGLGPAAGAKVADALRELAGRKAEARKAKKKGGDVPELETVVCGRNRLENGSMYAWAGMLRAYGGGVKVVKMVQNGIRLEGVEVLLREGLRGCGRLEVLDLQDNTFTIKGARALAGVVGGWTALRELGVGDCLVGGKGMVVLAGGLGKGGEALEVLRVQYNEIDGRGVKALVEVIKGGGLGKLRRVELNGNRFAEDDDAVEGLREILAKRREKAAGEGEEGEWGLDELSDLEEEDEDEDEEEEDDEGDEDGEEKVGKKDEAVEAEGRREGILKDADDVEGQMVAQKKDQDVDDLADKLGGTHV